MSNLLFSIDLEEFYPALVGSETGATPLPILADRYLDLLERHHLRATFFVVGDVARKYPQVLKKIRAVGHELGCHGNHHYTLEGFNRDTFAEDLRANKKAIEEVIGGSVRGFRAPLLSMTKEISWGHEVLAEEGFTYSSSVLPAANPLYGWPGFGEHPRKVSGIWEIPITLVHFPGFYSLPLFGGTYFRVLPWWLVRTCLTSVPQANPIVSYFHPYDIDKDQRWTMHVNANHRILHNYLLFFRRSSLLGRLEFLLKQYPEGMTYSEYISQLEAGTKA
jgi:polysaccharide deacetylase family protein (PEP-CTERM system associated)